MPCVQTALVYQQRVFLSPQQAILAKKFVEVMTKYNEAQMDFRDKSKGRIARQLEISESGLV